MDFVRTPQKEVLEMDKSEKSIMRSIYLVIIILCFILAFAHHSKGIDYGPLLLGASSCVLLAYAHFIMHRFFPEGDQFLFIIAAFIAQFGLVMIYRLNSTLAIKQIIWFTTGIGFFVLLLLFLPSIGRFEKLSKLYVVLAILLLASTLVLGKDINGSKNWLKFGGYSVQPSEFAKLFLILFLASSLKKIKRAKDVMVSAIPVFLCIGLLVVEKDLGGALIFFGIYMAMLFVETSSGLYMLAGFSFFGVFGVLSYFLFHHVKVRVEIWLNPFLYKAGNGNQICQSLIAIASGGLFGTGLGLGKPYYIPLAHSDFIFAAICEEFGALGALAILLMYLILIYRGLKIATSAMNHYSRLVAAGITSMIGFQVFVIIGGVTKMIPLTGVTLPFVSYGGTSMLLNFACLAILQKISESARNTSNEGSV